MRAVTNIGASLAKYTFLPSSIKSILDFLAKVHLVPVGVFQSWDTYGLVGMLAGILVTWKR